MWKKHLATILTLIISMTIILFGVLSKEEPGQEQKKGKELEEEEDKTEEE